MAVDQLPLEDVFQQFDDALAFLRARTPMPAEQFYTLTAQARQKAFTVSNVAQMDLVQQVLDSLEKAIETGQDLQSWKDEIGPALTKAWAGSVTDPAFRLETIYRNNLQTAFSHGRVRQMRDPAVTALRPYWLYDAILDSRTTDGCSARDGVLLLADDPWWATNTPPRHHRCRAGIRSLRKAQAERRGGINPPDREVELTPSAPGFGAAPTLSDAVQVKPWTPEITGHPVLEGARLRKEREFAAAEEERAARITELEKKYPRDVAEVIARGMESEERGLQRPISELRATANRLGKDGLQLGSDADWVLEQIEKEGYSSIKEALPAHRGFDEVYLRSAASILDHADTIKPLGDKLKVGWHVPQYGSAKAENDSALSFYRTMADRSIRHPTDAEVFFWQPRAFFLARKDRPLMGVSPQDGSFTHEWGHAIEHLNPRIGQRSIEFLRARTRNDILIEHTGKDNSGYGKGEVGKLDAFAHGYMGRIYDAGDGELSGTEILSMGLQEMVTGNAWFLRHKDKEMFHFCLGQLRGDGGPAAVQPKPEKPKAPRVPRNPRKVRYKPWRRWW